MYREILAVDIVVYEAAFGLRVVADLLCLLDWFGLSAAALSGKLVDFINGPLVGALADTVVVSATTLTFLLMTGTLPRWPLCKQLKH